MADIGKRAALPQQLQQVRLPVNGDSASEAKTKAVTNSFTSHLQESRTTPPYTIFANSNHAVTNSVTNSVTSPQEAQTRASWFVNHFQVKPIN